MVILAVNNSADYYGDDHKLYGYFSYDAVTQSFDYIHKFINKDERITIAWLALQARLRYQLNKHKETEDD